jgi:YHS domain-containing protein
MKHLTWLLAIAATGLTACNNTHTPKSTTTATPMAAASANDKKGKITDPVCGMEKDSTWTDNTVYKGDTVWFCSAREKQAFLDNPKRYVKH